MSVDAGVLLFLLAALLILPMAPLEPRPRYAIAAAVFLLALIWFFSRGHLMPR